MTTQKDNASKPTTSTEDNTAQLLASQALMQSWVLGEHQMNLCQEFFKSLTGSSDLAPAKGDKRFSDSTWESNPFYRALMQEYLAWQQEVDTWINDMGLDLVNTERLRFLAGLLTDAWAPTNTLLGNPAAVKKAFETGGMSLTEGLKNLLEDMANNGGMPSQVNKDAFKVGENLANTPGSVVFRSELLELIQYAPTTDQVHKRPLFIVPPQINKFYIHDLSPGRSMVEFAVAQGFQVFIVSWRNPTKEQGEWGMDSYVSALDEAVDVTCQITGGKDVNVLGTCAGGITAAILLGHWAARGVPKANSLSLAVNLLDMSGFEQSPLGLFTTPQVLELAKTTSGALGVLDGKKLGHLFAWLRPNDLVWAYWVNNYLMGNEPPSFDILYWNNDTNSMPAQLHADFIDMMNDNPLLESGRRTICETPIDLKKVTCDTYIVGGMTDHITPWEACYSSTSVFGGDTQFVLNSSGHVQTLVSPPGNPKAKYFTSDSTPEDPVAFLEGATENAGSWWEHWMNWLAPRSGDRKPAPKKLGSRKHPAKEAAPGTYVFEE
jgi:polyhydroxyalkanoate synthase